jgi:ATP-dependent Lon protease
MMSETCAKKILQYIHDETVNFISNKNNIYHLHFEIEGMQKKLVTLNITDEVREEVQKIIDQLKNSIVFSAETAMLQNHVEWLVNLPWGIETEDNTNLVHAKLILDQEHFGLEDVKEKVLDYLAIKAFKKDCKGQVLCLCGPPGVGKTSIGKSIAKALGKRFFRISLGGLHDESEIRGHRKTYVGAMPGRLIQAIKNVGSCNPLIMLDEIDKMGKSVNGDPCAALLEVFDPEQNIRFYDNYLGVPFDLSHVMFIATANYIENIPKPLQDRMEMVMLRGYTAEEKLEITKRHLLPKAIKESGLEEKGFTVDNSILINLITQHSHEGGVREIDRHIKKLCAKFVRRLLEDECLTK